MCQLDTNCLLNKFVVNFYLIGLNLMYGSTREWIAVYWEMRIIQILEKTSDSRRHTEQLDRHFVLVNTGQIAGQSGQISVS